MPHDVVAEVEARFGHSKQPESIKLVAITKATAQVVRMQGLEVSPVSIFSALTSTLTSAGAQDEGVSVFFPAFAILSKSIVGIYALSLTYVGYG